MLWVLYQIYYKMRQLLPSAAEHASAKTFFSKNNNSKIGKDSIFFIFIVMSLHDSTDSRQCQKIIED